MREPPRPPRRRLGAVALIGRCYLLNGEPVVVVTQWGLKSRGETYGGPRNVRILFPDGTTTIRPFRGLRRLRLREALTPA